MFRQVPNLRATNLNGLQGTVCVQSFASTDYGAEMDLDTLMTMESTSLTCIPAKHCEPLGGYSSWVSLPPLRSATRRQIVVLTHWDSIGLFRSAGSRINVRSQTLLVARLTTTT